MLKIICCIANSCEDEKITKIPITKAHWNLEIGISLVIVSWLLVIPIFLDEGLNIDLIDIQISFLEVFGVVELGGGAFTKIAIKRHEAFPGAVLDRNFDGRGDIQSGTRSQNDPIVKT